MQTTEAYITSKFGWGLTKRIESHGLARFKAHVQKARSTPYTLHGSTHMHDSLARACLS